MRKISFETALIVLAEIVLIRLMLAGCSMPRAKRFLEYMDRQIELVSTLGSSLALGKMDDLVVEVFLSFDD